MPPSAQAPCTSWVGISATPAEARSAGDGATLGGLDATRRAHRGGTILAIGILSLVVAVFLVPLGVVAWILGSRDLRGMDQGRVDPAGRSLTQMGRVFGFAATVLIPAVLVLVCTSDYWRPGLYAFL